MKSATAAQVRARGWARTVVQSWLERLCAATEAHPRAQLWVAVARFTQAYIEVETQGFDLLEA